MADKKGMFENLNQPYHFNNNFKHNLRTITLVCMGFMLIVLYFQPFGINFLASPKNGYFVLAVGLISAATFLFNTLVLPGLFTKVFEPTRWTIRKEIVWNVWMFALMVTTFTMAAFYFDIPALKLQPLFGSAALALLPIVLFNLVNYNISLKSRVVQFVDSRRHLLTDETGKSIEHDDKKFHIESENGKESFDEEARNIVLIQSASNYIEIFYRDSAGGIRKQMIRQTLSKAESELADCKGIKRCHRCCLVNLNQVTRLTGSLSNYHFEVDGLDDHIPVARQNVAELRKLLKKIKPA